MLGVKTRSPSSVATRCLAENHKAKFYTGGTGVDVLLGAATNLRSTSELVALLKMLFRCNGDFFILSDPFICIARLRSAINAAALGSLVAQFGARLGWLWLCCGSVVSRLGHRLAGGCEHPGAGTQQMWELLGCQSAPNSAASSQLGKSLLKLLRAHPEMLWGVLTPGVRQLCPL